MSEFGLAAALLLTLSACAPVSGVSGTSGASGASGAPRYGIGRAPTAAEIAGWDIDARADGAGLPAGSGTVAQGQRLFEAQCASCHGARGEGGVAPRLAGGQGTLTSRNPVLTVGSYWPYATTVYDYIRRAMPFDRPQSLSSDEVYAVTAYTLKLNGIVADDARLDAASLARIRMPNRGGFTAPDPRPDTGR